jgi:hypothetical protein
LGGKKGHPFYTFAFDVLVIYWERHSSIVDFHLFDHVLQLAYETIDVVKKDIDAIPINGNDRFELERLLSYVYNQNEMDALANSDTMFFKLNLKREYSEYTKDGEETVYKRLINGTMALSK